MAAALLLTAGLAARSVPSDAASMPPTAAAGASGGASGGKVAITRDSAGIPHIRAANFTALGYGEALAFSQDNFCTLAQDFVTVNGQRSKYFGPKALSLNYSAGASDTNLDSDFFWKSVKARGLLTKEIHQAPPLGPLPQILAVYNGFVSGYNTYLRSGKLTDPACAGKPWVRPITLTDMLLRGYQVVIEASSAQFITMEAKAKPPAPSPSATTPTSTATATTASVGSAAPNASALVADFGSNGNDTLGSNGIGIGSQDTAAGDGMLLANPHFPWRGTERFWMVQLTVPGQYNVEGGTLEGFPLVGIGFNRHLAWTHTVSTSFRFTFYQLQLVPGDPTSYTVDGQVHKMGRLTVLGRHRPRHCHPHLLHHPLGHRRRRGPGRLPLDQHHRLRSGRLHGQRQLPGRQPVPAHGTGLVGAEPAGRGVPVPGHPHVQHDRLRRQRQAPTTAT